jgi:hypothetical protein
MYLAKVLYTYEMYRVSRSKEYIASDTFRDT